ncbi:lysophospholipase [Singulisphaera acidiphila DSM 18658]|uniref:Lysophospholipase n=1 Tax=Singulisphaera acidiphila (strain ATCC BAA-1392 / DSM 18658 / VKM B-2454 / MOB10) TaxID=886293 RepID=L0DMR7_SINAD|nr:alpha/beta fold hydrolase [Singulisphaera acidiphila]AGA29956.1 lysophospholipase [Singulisphaera acidiphila DSM 18658]
MIALLALLVNVAAGFTVTADREPIEIRIPLVNSREIDVGELAARISALTGVRIKPPVGKLLLPVAGVGGSLSRTTLGAILGDDARLEVDQGVLVVNVDRRVLDPDRLPGWTESVQRLAEHVDREAKRRAKYGMRALKSYRPNDLSRPTICLVHGLNSSSGGFVHMITPLEEAGYGLVVYDYPYNRNLTESSAQFARDWQAFRRLVGEKHPWAIVAHSMGALVARSFVEDPAVSTVSEISSLIMVAPVNQGSSLAKAQTFLQLLNGVQAIQNKKTTEALAHLGDGLGEAAEDLTPGSRFLTALNRRTRRDGVPYHIVAGDAGIVSGEARRTVEERINAIRKERGLLGGLTRFATADLSTRLDEVSDGFGDGCVSVASSRLPGVTDHVVIHANHAELIRAPLLFANPGPVACMPYLLRWLDENRSQANGNGPGQSR